MVGEIQDEFDHEQPLITQIQENEYLVDGATPLHDVEEAFGVRFNDENDAATLGGYLVDRWQEIPAERHGVALRQTQVCCTESGKVSGRGRFASRWRSLVRSDRGCVCTVFPTILNLPKLIHSLTSQKLTLKPA